MILTLSGASGTGKTSIEQALIDRLPNARPLLSITTRKSRPTDIMGDFQHVSGEEFTGMEQRGEFLWHAAIGETRYGTRRTDLQYALAHPNIIWIMILIPSTVQNLLQAAAAEPGDHDIRSFYILNPSDDILRKRLLTRGETEEAIASRALKEMAHFEQSAKQSGLPFIEIADNDDLEEKIQAVIAHANAQ
jgi:guanylate kinase